MLVQESTASSVRFGIRHRVTFGPGPSFLQLSSGASRHSSCLGYETSYLKRTLVSIIILKKVSNQLYIQLCTVLSSLDHHLFTNNMPGQSSTTAQQHKKRQEWSWVYGLYAFFIMFLFFVLSAVLSKIQFFCLSFLSLLSFFFVIFPFCVLMTFLKKFLLEYNWLTMLC